MKEKKKKKTRREKPMETEIRKEGSSSNKKMQEAEAE